MAKVAWQKFHAQQGFLLEQQSELAKPYFQAAIEDGPLPSPSSVLIDTSLQSGDRELHDLARNALADSAVLQKQGMFWFASQVMALSRLFSISGKR